MEKCRGVDEKTCSRQRPRAVVAPSFNVVRSGDWNVAFNLTVLSFLGGSGVLLSTNLLSTSFETHNADIIAPST